MKTGNLAGIAALIALAGACVPSVNPYYTEKDVVFDTRLLGQWQTSTNASDQQTWKFEKSGDNAYKLIVTEEEGKHGEMDARLFKIKDQLFLDVMPNDIRFAPDEAAIVAASMWPGHLLLRVPQMEPNLRLAACDYDWLTKYLEAHPKALAHHDQNQGMLLTAGTKALQGFVLQHLSELFKTPEELTRKPGAGAQSKRIATLVEAAPEDGRASIDVAQPSAPASHGGVPPPVGRTWIRWPSDLGGNNHYYALTPWATNWATAQALAVSWGGRLATITSSSEQDFINRTFLVGRFEHLPVWIGLVKPSMHMVRIRRAMEDLGVPHAADPPPFKWVSGEPLSYSNWHPGQPDDCPPGENYAAMNWHYSDSPPRGTKGDWNDAPLNGTTGFGGKTDGPYFGLIERETAPSQPPHASSHLPLPYLGLFPVLVGGLIVVLARFRRHARTAG